VPPGKPPRHHRNLSRLRCPCMSRQPAPATVRQLFPRSGNQLQAPTGHDTFPCTHCIRTACL
jgi:hypothetical protein